MAREPKPRFRQGVGIGLEEYGKDNFAMVREFQTELMMLRGYIGYFDTWDETLRVFIFDNIEDAAKAVKGAEQIGFRTVGNIEGPVHIANSELTRPHLKYYKGYDYHRELYR